MRRRGVRAVSVVANWSCRAFLLALIFAAACSSQDAVVIPLPAEETAKLRKLYDDYQQTQAAALKAADTWQKELIKLNHSSQLGVSRAYTKDFTAIVVTQWSTDYPIDNTPIRDWTQQMKRNYDNCVVIQGIK